MATLSENGYLVCAMKLWLMLAGVFSCVSASQAANLVDSVNAARTFDTGLAAARAAYGAGQEKRWQGLAGLLPRAQVVADYTKQDQPSAPYAAAVHRHSYSVNVTQPLFDMSRVAGYRRGNVLADKAEVEFRKAEQQVIVAVSDAYFDVLYQHDVLEAARSARQAFARQLDRAQAALDVGDGTRTEVSEAQANFDEADARAVTAENDLEVARVAYRRLTGLDGAALQPIAWQCTSRVPPPSLDVALGETDAENLDVRAAEFALAQAKTDVMDANAAHLPVLDLRASYGTNWSRGANQNELDRIFGTTSKTRSTTVGVTLTIPLFAGGARLSQSREAYRLRDQAENLLEDARRKARQGARSAYLGVIGGAALIRARERAVTSAGTKVESTRYGREVGLRTGIDELNAQQQYYDAIRSLAEARYKYLKDRISLSAVLGRLGDQDLESLECRASTG